MSEIKIYKFDSQGTHDDIKRRFDNYRTKVDRRHLAIWRDFILVARGPPQVKLESIMAISIKSFLPWCLPVFDGNPNAQVVERPNSVQLENDADIHGIDKSNREYSVPHGQKYRIVGLYTQFRKDFGALVDDYGGMPEIYSKTWPAFMPAKLAPLPFLHANIVLFDDLATLAKEINQVRDWYLRDTLMYLKTGVPNDKLPAKDDTKKHAVAADVTSTSMPVDVIEQLSDRKYGRVYASSRIADLQASGALDTASASGKTRDAMLNILTQIKRNRELLLHQTVVNYRITAEKATRQALAKSMFDLELETLTEKQRASLEKKLLLIESERVNVNDPITYMLQSLREAFGTPNLKKVWIQVKTVFDVPDAKKLLDQKTMLAPIDQPERKILCPHIVDHVVMSVASDVSDQNPGFQDFVNFEDDIGQRLVERWAENVPINDQYYCKVCSELIYVDMLEDFNIFGPQAIIASTGDWDTIKTKIFAEVQQVVRLVRFKKMITRNQKSLITSVSNSLHPEIVRLQNELQTTKTRSIDDVALILTLYISIYAFAFMCKLIIDNSDKAEWNVNTESKGTIVARTLAIAHALIVNSKGTLIARIKDFSSEMIKPVFLQAYTYANKALFQTEDEHDDNILLMQYAIENDQTYAFANTMYNIDHSAYSMKAALGAFDPALPYAHLYIPKRSIKSYQNYLKYIQEIAPKNYNAVPVDPILEAWWKTNDASAPVSTNIVWGKAIMYREKRETDTLRDSHLSDVYCPKGTRHRFGLFIFGKERLTLQEVIRAKMQFKPLTSIECVLCGEKPIAPPQDRTAVLAEISAREYLFKYFANRCPVKTLHEYSTPRHAGELAAIFVGDAPCTHCGYCASFAQSQPADWYKKWKSAIPKYKIALVPLPNGMPLERPVAKNWTLTLGSVLAISKQSNYVYNLWINLGLSEKISWSALKNNQINPSTDMPEARVGPRNIKLLGYIELCRRLYYTIKNHNHIELPMYIKFWMDQARPDSSPADLPDIFVNFTPAAYEGAKLSNYLLHTLCFNLMLTRQLTGKIHRFAAKIFQFICDQIMRAERLVSDIDVKVRFIAATGDEDAIAPIEENELVGVDDTPEEDIAANEFSLADVDIEDANTGSDD